MSPALDNSNTKGLIIATMIRKKRWRPYCRTLRSNPPSSRDPSGSISVYDKFEDFEFWRDILHTETTATMLPWR